ncbi:PAS domain S-box protein [Halobacterium yunchengense]|uniref:PAS domain S-box protein n=1 Tax=Halobacterium yunchengense TaxID=3108497 RepID=UPI003007F941
MPVDEPPIRVLLVDDDAAFADLTAEFLEREREDFAATTRSSADDALEYLAANRVDCVVSDHDMPGRDGLELLDAVREAHPDLPFVLFTGKGSEEIASDAISAGVTDYLQKESGTDQYAVLANTVRNAVEKRRSERALREEKHLLEQVLATTPGSVVFRPDGTVASATDRARATLGLAGDTPETPDWEFVTLDGDPLPDDRHPARRVARTGQRLYGERLGVEWPDGWRKYLVLHCAPLFDDDGDVDRVVASFTDVTDRVEADREAERASTIVDAVGDAVYTLDERGEFTFVNDAFEALTDRDRADLLGAHCSVVMDDDALREGTEIIEDLLAGDRESGLLELRVDDWAAGVEHVECHIALLPHDTDFEGTAGVVRDVTERERRERRLRESEQKYATVVEEASDAVVIAQGDELRFGNPRAADILGLDQGDVEGTPVADIVAPEDRETVLDRLRRRLAGEDPEDRYEFHALTADGDRVPLEFTAARITYDGDPAVLAICRDVSERRERARERRQYETIVETAPDGVFIVDEEANYVGGNVDGAGVRDADLAGRSVPELVEDGVFDPEVVPRYRETVRELLAADDEDAKGKFEFHVSPAGSDDERVVECHLALRPHDDEFRGTIGVLRDVTDRRRRERELERQNARLDEFTSVVSHDLRSPLNVATGWLDQYRETGDGDALDRVERAHGRMADILDELLALAREGADARDTDAVSLDAVSASAWASVATGDASLAVDADGHTVDAVRGRLQQLLENLFANAVEHGSPSPDSQARGDRATAADGGDGLAVTVGVLEDDDGFYVADDGAGIPADEREDVFETGYTTSSDGTGFGLAIVDRVADAHDWDVAVADSDAGGARFEFRTGD